MKTSPVKLPKETRIICLPFSRASYPNIVNSPELFRHELDEKIARFPELFPKEIKQGYLMKDSRVSKVSAQRSAYLPYSDVSDFLIFQGNKSSTLSTVSA